MNCGEIDRSLAKHAIERTNQSGKEHGFVQCPDGTHSKLVAGDDDSMELGDEIANACQARGVGIFHTHPNGIPELSDIDRKTLQENQNVDMVCVGVQHSDGKKMHCERAQPSCSTRLEQPAETERLDLNDAVVFMFPNTDGCRCSAWAKQFEELAQGEQVVGVTSKSPSEIKEFSDKLGLSYPIVSDPDGEIPGAFGLGTDGDTPRAVVVRRNGETVEAHRGPYEYNVAERSLQAYNAPEKDLGQPDELAKLPKGSSCERWKNVPSRSDYHNADEVERCAKWDTNGKRDGDGDSGMQFMASGENKIFKPAFDAVKRVARNKGGRSQNRKILLKTSGDTLTLRAVDIQNVQMAEVTIDKSDIGTSEWSNVEFAVPYSFARNVTDLKMGDSIKMKFSPETPEDAVDYAVGRLTLTKTSTEGNEEVYSAIVTDEVRNFPDPGDIEGNPDVQVELTAAKFKKVIRGAHIIDKESLWFVANDRRAWVYAGGTNQYTGELTDDDVRVEAAEMPVASHYGMTYLRPLSLAPPRPKSTELRLQWGEMYPLRIEYDVDGSNVENAAHVELLVAPRTADDPPEDYTVSQPDLHQPRERDPVTLGEGDRPEIIEEFHHPSVGLILGERGSGKSSTAYRIAEAMHEHTGVLPVAVGVPAHKREYLPDDWVHVEQIDDAPSDSVVVVDEAYTQYHATEWQDKDAIEMSKLVNLSRHCGRTILFVTQESRQLNKNGVSQADAVFMKRPAPLQIEFERRGVRDLMENARSSFDQLPNDMDHRAFTYVYTGEDVGLVRTDETDWYGDEMSRSYEGACGGTSESDDEQDASEDETSDESDGPHISLSQPNVTDHSHTDD